MPDASLQIQADWVAADWGTSSLRTWAMSEDGTVLDHRSTEQGMAKVRANGLSFEATLLESIAPWLKPDSAINVLACGMVGAKGGWQEIPYTPTPASPSTPPHQVTTSDPRIAFWVHEGLSQNDPADVMRGEETQLAGLLKETPGFEGLVCLPGTHSKWAHLERGQVLEFHTFQTGELFGLLAEQSILHLTLADDGWDEVAFLEGVREGHRRPGQILTRTFSLRAEALLANLDGAKARSRLSGLLIGNELAGALEESMSKDPIGIIGKNELSSRYALALEDLDRKSLCFDAKSLTLAGLRQGWEHLPRT